MTDDLRHGAIASWHDMGGFGFIRPDDGTPEVYVHATSLAARHPYPQKGERVSFHLAEPNERGPRASWCSRSAAQAGSTAPPVRDATVSA
jgi:cold shock CspA family protein